MLRRSGLRLFSSLGAAREERGASRCVAPQEEERKWREFFEDNRGNDRNGFPDFRNVATRAGLWVGSPHCPEWVHQRLKFLKPPGASQGARAEYSSEAAAATSSSSSSSREDLASSKSDDPWIGTGLSSLLAGLKACSRSRNLRKGIELHAQAVHSGNGSNKYVETSLINMYSSCGNMMEARSVFDKMIHPNVVAWNALLQGYVDNGESELALEMFDSMKNNKLGCARDARTYLAALTACATMGAKEDEQGRRKWLRKGLAVHSEAASRSCCDVFVENALVDMYAKCGSMLHAQSMFDNMMQRTVVSWTCLLQGYVESGNCELALELFDGMQEDQSSCPASPDVRTYMVALSACSNLAATNRGEGNSSRWLEKGKAIHSAAVMNRCYDNFIESILLKMYTRCGSTAHAQAVFDSRLQHDAVSWTTLIMGYVETGKNEQALQLIAQMDVNGVQQDSATLVAALLACSNLMALEKGTGWHAEIRECGLEQDTVVANCLVDFYARCGRLDAAQQVFDSVSRKTVVTWSALMRGYGLRGDSDRVFELFKEMRKQGIRPDEITFTHVLNACNHAGLVDKGMKYLELMFSRYGIAPGIVHYSCVVDLLGRANRVDEALKMLKSMPVEPNAVTWRAVLAACQKWTNVGVAREAFEALVKLDGKDSSAYSLMANIYSSREMEEKTTQVALRE